MSDTRPSEKRCIKCGETKPLDAFSKNKREKDGHQNQCKACNAAYHAANAERKRAYDQAYRVANSERIRENKAAYYAANADRFRKYQATYYAANGDKVRRRNTAYQATNAEAIRAYKRAHYLANLDKIREQKATYQAANADKIRDYQALYRNANVERLREYLAAYRTANAERLRDYVRVAKHKRRALEKSNGGSFTARELALLRVTQSGFCAYCHHYHPDTLHLDHITPIAQGGRHDAANICLACSKCNLSKNNRTPDQWQNRWYYHQIDPYSEQVFGRWND